MNGERRNVKRRAQSAERGHARQRAQAGGRGCGRGLGGGSSDAVLSRWTALISALRLGHDNGYQRNNRVCVWSARCVACRLEGGSHAGLPLQSTLGVGMLARRAAAHTLDVACNGGWWRDTASALPQRCSYCNKTMYNNSILRHKQWSHEHQYYP